MKNVLITILGRGGSKGVPGKNIRPFLGVPLIALSIYDAHQALGNRDDIQKTIAIDSDDPGILEVAAQFTDPGDILHLRDASLATDSAPKGAAIRRLLCDVEEQTGTSFDYLIDLDITSPLRTERDIESVLATIERNRDLDVVFSVVPARRNPYFNMVEQQADTQEVQLVKPAQFHCRQDAPAVYEMNASIYAYSCSIMRASGKLLFENRCGIVLMKDYGVLDIDSPEDHALMQLIYKEICIPENSYFERKLRASLRIPGKTLP